MNRCPITYQECSTRYSARGLRLLSPSLKEMVDLPYSAAEQLHEAAARAAKMSVQGVQPKLSAVLLPAANGFVLVDSDGRYILKPQHPAYPSLPENEALTMRLAALVGIEVPFHGLVWCVDGSLTYFVRRFDRRGRTQRVAVEDFGQLSGGKRSTKYDFSMEKLVKIIDANCTFPMVDRLKLFRISLFCFLTGNEDMHIKNFSLLTDAGKVGLSPAYDLLNTTLVLPSGAEELALPLRGKRRRITRADLLDYWASQRLELPPKAIATILDEFKRSLPAMVALVELSFLNAKLREGYLAILRSRGEMLGLL